MRFGGFNMSASNQAVLEGPWLMKETGSGNIQGGTYRHNPTKTSEPCMLVWGGPWLFEACNIHVVNGVALVCTQSAAMLLQRWEKCVCVCVQRYAMRTLMCGTLSVKVLL